MIFWKAVLKQHVLWEALQMNLLTSRDIHNQSRNMYYEATKQGQFWFDHDINQNSDLVYAWSLISPCNLAAVAQIRQTLRSRCHFSIRCCVCKPALSTSEPSWSCPDVCEVSSSLQQCGELTSVYFIYYF